MPKAYSYLRFSTPEQARGDSYRRQTELAERYAREHGLDLDTDLRLQDRGVSGFRGANVRKGALRQFLDAVENDLVEPGSYLLVESLDRVSRQDPWEALPTFQQIINAGVVLVTLQDGRAWAREDLRANPLRLMESLLVMMRAHEESVTKSRRLKASWSNKRAQATTKALTARAPAWLRLNGERQWEVLEDRAEVVRRVYRMTAAGAGQHAIAEALNRDDVPTFGDGHRKARHWHSTYVAKLLRSPAVVGTLVPHVVEHEEGKRARKPQQPVEGYYPAVVDRDLFERVQAMRIDTKAPQRGRHAHAPMQNVLGGLGRCPLCGGTMTRVSKGPSTKAGKPYLVCTKAKAGAGCRYRAVPLERVETAMRESAERLCHEAPAPAAGGDLQDELVGLRVHIDASEEAVQNLVAELAIGPSSAVRTRLRETEADLEAMREQERALLQRISATQGPLVERRLADLESALLADPFDVGRANAALRQVLSSVVVDYPKGDLVFHWLHGGDSRLTFGWPEAEAA